VSNYRLYTFIFLLCFGTGVAAPVHSAERISFDQTVNARVQKNIDQYVEAAPGVLPEPIHTAGVDLNEDGVKEFIITSSNCKDNKDICTYIILADKGKDLLKLGNINAYNILLADSYSHGVRDILAFEDINSDFDYTLYVWEPARSRYTIAGKGPDIK